MKRILLFVLCLALSNSAITQITPLPLPTNGIYWMASYPVMVPGSPIGYGNGLHGTTTVNDTTYHVICNINYCGGDTTFVPTGLLIREDSGKWMIRNWMTLYQEVLLFDFTSEVGDTIIVNDPWCQMEHVLIVYSIDTIITPDGVSRRRWTADYGSPFGPCAGPDCQYIEGIGSSTKGLNQPNIGSGCIDQNEGLICFIENDLKIHSTEPLESSLDCCAFILIEEVKSQINYRLFPNPSQNELILETESINLTFQQIEFYDFFGRTTHLPMTSKNEKSIQWDTSGIPAGIYFISIINKYGVRQNIKFTVMR